MEKDDCEAYTNIINSHIHHMDCKRAILPYYDPIDWIMSREKLQSKVIVSIGNHLIGSIHAKDLSIIYKIRGPNKLLNETFLPEFK